MKASLKSILKYTFFLLVASGLLYYVYGNQDFSQVINDVKRANPYWIFASAVAALTSHLARGWRWKIALQPSGYHMSPFRSFLAVMVGYLANLFVPRMGEIARCGILNKTDTIPVNISFGAVLAERALDLIILLSLTCVTTLIEFERIGNFLTERLKLSAELFSVRTLIILAGLGLFGVIALFLIYQQRHRLINLPFYGKAVDFLLGLKEGLLSITQLNATQKAGYIFHTVVIWLMYYTMTYVLFFTQPETSDLSMLCALSVFIMGGIGIVIPTPGGIGSYHLFVGATLMAYGLGESDSKAFAFLMHSAQTLVIIVVGGVSLLIASLLKVKEGKIESDDLAKIPIENKI